MESSQELNKYSHYKRIETTKTTYIKFLSQYESQHYFINRYIVWIIKIK